MARDIAASLGKKFSIPRLKKLPKSSSALDVSIKNKDRCSRYIAARFIGVKVGATPSFITKALKECGIQSINNVVDILNYVMIEVGQPMHAFDAEKMDGKRILVRTAHKGEQLTTLDNKRVVFGGGELLIVDDKSPLAIAGIKGGKKADIDGKTNEIIVEAATFDSLSVYTTSRVLGTTTDASLRFSRTLSSVLSEWGMQRARELLEEHANAKLVEWTDTSTKEPARHVVRFDMDRFVKFGGVDIAWGEVVKHLKNLGFEISTFKNKPMSSVFLAQAPIERLDIEHFEDVAEEVLRMHGFNTITPKSPNLLLRPSGFEESIEYSDKVKDALVGMGYSEVYTNSFVPEGYASRFDNLVEIQSPPSARYQFLRPLLQGELIEAIEQNKKHYDQVSLFEIGKVFVKNKHDVIEHTSLGIAHIHKKETNPIPHIKGVVIALMKTLGMTDWDFVESSESVWSEHGGFDVKVGGVNIGWMGPVAMGESTMGYVELDADALFAAEEGEYEYSPISRFPASERDISVEVDINQKIGGLIEEISLTNVDLIRDVDVIDEYRGAELNGDKKSVTLRIVFQSDKKTLTEKEISGIMKTITTALKGKFRAEVR